MAKKKNNVTGLDALKARVAAVLALQPATSDQSAIRVLLGDPQPLGKQQDVGYVFGQSTNTVQRSWRSNGMPGDAGAYCPVAILCWLIERNNRNASQAAPLSRFKQELGEIELESARATLDLRLAKLNQLAGGYVQLVAVQATMRGILNVVRDAFLNIPRKWTVRFPTKYAAEWTAELESDIRSVLTIIAETPVDEFIARIEQRGKMD